MHKEHIRGIIGITLASALAFGVAFGIKGMRGEEEVYHGIQLEGHVESMEGVGNDVVQSVAKVTEKNGTISGYVMTVKEAGYGGDMLIDVALSSDGTKILGVHVTEHQETEGIGSAITEQTFLDQFKGMETPVYMEGVTSVADTKADGKNTITDLKDGQYIAKAEKADDNGFVEQLTMTIQNGTITAINWDCVKEDGTRKSKLSEEGQYVMTEDGLTWSEQAKALAETVIRNQTVEAVGMNEQGKTDSVAGVSIYIGGFVQLAQDCLEQAGGKQAEQTPEVGTQIDAISGATISSKAVARAIDKAYAFLEEME